MMVSRHANNVLQKFKKKSKRIYTTINENKYATGMYLFIYSLII